MVGSEGGGPRDVEARARTADFWESPESIVKTIEPLRFRGNEVVLFHVLDPKDVRPDLRGPLILVDLETEEKLEVTPDYAKREYLTLRGGRN